MQEQHTTPTPAGPLPWITVVETVSVVAGLGGAIAAVVSQQVLLAAAASASISIAGGLNLINRQRLAQSQWTQLLQSQQAQPQLPLSQPASLSTLMQQQQQQQQRLELLTQRIDGMQDLTSNLSKGTQDLHDYTRALGTEQKQIESVVGCLREIESCTLAIQLNPNQAKPYYNRGLTHHRLGDLPAAIADYSEAIHFDPTYAKVYHNRGLAYSATGEKKKALEDLRTAAKYFLEQGDVSSYQKAKELCKRLHELETQTMSIKDNLAAEVLFA